MAVVEVMRVPNAETQAAMRDAREGRVTRVSSVAALMADLDSDDCPPEDQDRINQGDAAR